MEIEKLYTKDDMMSAFCAAEEYVDFYKWIEAYKPIGGNLRPERKVIIMTNALDTILSEAKEPIIKVYAQSALDETKEVIKKDNKSNAHCKKHNWFGLYSEGCPECSHNHANINFDTWNDMLIQLEQLQRMEENTWDWNVKILMQSFILKKK